MRTNITRTTTSLAGVALTTAAADSVNGMQLQNNGNQVLHVTNGSASSITVTIDMAADRFGRDGTKVITIPAGEQRYIGPFDPFVYNQNGYVNVDFSASASVTVGVLSLQS